MRNTLLFKQIIDVIQTWPERWDQSNFARTWDDDLNPIPLEDCVINFEWDGQAEVTCGTTQCVAGWAVAISDKEKFVKNVNNDTTGLNWTEDGRDALGITGDEADWLFWNTFRADLNTMCAILWLFAAGAKLETIKSVYKELS